MKLVSRSALFFVATISAIGCGDKDPEENPQSADATAAQPFHGIYETKEVKVNNATCEDQGLVATTDSFHFREKFFKLGKKEFFGQTLPLAFFKCASPDQCSDSMYLNWTFSRFEEGKWVNEPSKSSSPAGDTGFCYFNFSHNFAYMQDGLLVLREESHSGKVPLPEGSSSCTGEDDILDKLYEANKGTMPCDDLLVVTASKIRE